MTHTSKDVSKDACERRCPRLGGWVTFGYCRSEGEIEGVCPKIFDCWWEQFDVVSYLRNRLPSSVFEAVRNAVPRPKVATILDLIEKAKKIPPVDPGGRQGGN